MTSHLCRLICPGLHRQEPRQDKPPALLRFPDVLPDPTVGFLFFASSIPRKSVGTFMGHSGLFFSCGFLSCPARRSAGRHCVNFIAFADRRGFSPIPPRDNKGALLVRRLFAFWRYRTLPVITPRDFRGKASESVDQKRGGRKQDIRKGPPWHGRKTGIGRRGKKDGRYRKGDPHRKKPWQEAKSFPVWSPTRDLTDSLPTFPSRHNHGDAKKRRPLLGS